MQDFFISSGKRKRDDLPPQYRAGGYIPQQDGAGDNISDEDNRSQNLKGYPSLRHCHRQENGNNDVILLLRWGHTYDLLTGNSIGFLVNFNRKNRDFAMVCYMVNKVSVFYNTQRKLRFDFDLSDDFVGMMLVSSVVQGGNQQMFFQVGTMSSRIPQLDGPIPDPYDDVLSTPNIYNYQGVVNEDYNIVNTPMPNEMHAATPAPVQNDTGDDDDDEPLNEDDDDDLDDVDQGEDLNTTHLVLAQFDKVTRTKSRWKCTLKDGIMHINNKDILFNKATGEFDF
ncbi:UNVERIFIED_CONTAM: Transcription initiation factor IIA subunit 1 [Sesamum indicum]